MAPDMSPHLPLSTEVPPTPLSRNLAHLVRIILVMETALRLNYSSPGLSEDFLEEYNISLDELTRLLNHSHVQTSWKPPPQCYCGGKMKEVLAAYKAVHGYLALVVCLFGTVANVLNVVVLTRKDMKAAPINRILKALAIADMLVMVEYVPFTLYFYLVLPGQVNMPYHWAVYVLFHSHFTQVLHTISICLTLVLAIWRYIAIRFPQKSHVLCSAWRCKLAIIIGYSLPVLVCIPSYLVFRIQATAAQSDHGEVLLLYHIDLSDMARKHDETLYYVNLWIYGVVIKLLPCVILTVISCWLIKALYRANRRKQALKGFNSNCNAAAPLAPNSRPPTRSERRTDRTTKMLVAVLLLFLITEFPQGILGLLSGVFGRCFFRTCYTMFGEVMDILALLNGAINFILYCSMSRQFRTTFGQLFKPRMLANWNMPASQTEVQSTYV